MADISCEAILGRILNLDEEKIKEALSLTKDYKVVKAQKKGGGYRTIYIPPPFLKKVQRAIVRRLFQRIWKEWWINLWLYGVRRKTSYVDHARIHEEAKWVFQFDLKDAFPSVSVSSLKKILLEGFLGRINAFEWSTSRYRDVVRKLEKAKKEGDEWGIRYRNESVEDAKKEVLTSVFSSTNLEQWLELEKEDEWFFSWILPQREELVKGLTDLVIELTTFQGILPQGTPTAPFLFYLFLTEGDLFTKLRAVCPDFEPQSQDRYNFRISAYIDNFVISAQKPIPKKNQDEVIKTLREFGLKVNPRKTRNQGTIYGAPLITGLRIVSENGKSKVVLPKRKIRQIRGLIHRAIFDPEIRPKVKGLIDSLTPIYGVRPYFYQLADEFYIRPNLPSQLKKPLHALLLKLKEEERGNNKADV